MSPSELFNDILSNIDPHDVPSEYISFAHVTDIYGVEKVIETADLASVLKDRRNFTDMRIVLNVRKIRDVIASRVNEIYDGINALCMQDGYDEDFDELPEFKGLPDPTKDTDI